MRRGRCLELLVAFSLILHGCGRSSSDSSDKGNSGGNKLDPSDLPPPPDPTDDDRNDASATPKGPSLDSSLDPRSFSVTKDPKTGRGVASPGLTANRIGVVYDGRQHAHPTCKNALPYQGGAELSPTIDGALDDWGKKGLAAIDRAGDGVSANGVTYDIREFYVAEDDQSLYWAARFEEAWPSETSPARLTFRVRSLGVPTSSNASVTSKKARNLALFGTTLTEAVDGAYENLDSAVYDIAVDGRTLEVRIDKGEIEGTISGDHYTVQPSLWAGDTSSSKRDVTGPYMAGLKADYACLVPTPDQSFKMVVMQRAAAVGAGKAELLYRAMAAAIPAVESVTEDRFAGWDSFSFVAVPDMKTAGLFVNTAGIFAKAKLSEAFGGGPVDAFHVTAHEYAHTLNAADYDLPAQWMREGQSEWVAMRAASSYYGPAVGQFRKRRFLKEFQEIEEEKGFRSLDRQTWGADRSKRYYYSKSGIFFELLSGLLDAKELRAALSRGKDGEAFSDTASFLDAVAAKSTFSGSASGSLWSGWIGADGYGDGALPKGKLLADQDGDGLFQHDEKARGLFDDKADQDGDGWSDFWEIGAGQDPKSPANAADARIVVDQHLGDWKNLASDALVKAKTQSSGDSKCGDFTKVKRFGALFDGDWLVVGVDLAAAAADRKGSVTARVVRPDGSKSQLQLDFQEAVIHGLDGNGNLMRKAEALARGSHGAVEIYFHRSWFGWDKFKNGTTVNVATHAGPDGSRVQCDVTQKVFPSYEIP